MTFELDEEIVKVKEALEKKRKEQELNELLQKLKDLWQTKEGS